MACRSRWDIISFPFWMALGKRSTEKRQNSRLHGLEISQSWYPSFFGRIVPQIWARKYWICNIFIIAMIASMIIILGSWLPSRSNAAIIVFTPSRAIGSPAIGGLVKAPRPATAKAVPIRYPISLGGDMVNAIMGPSPIVAPDAKPNRRGDYVYASVFSGVAYAVSNMLPRGPS